ncbi:MAG: cytochrome c biogenesis protein CcsA [Planctomycetes bacterium]|nr:cytochrome c biogenesis protein CcsA [Planctomycetota bacterium]
MFELPPIEKILFLSVLAVFALGSIVGFLQLSRGRDRYRRTLILLIALGICLESLLLVVRALAVGAIPLTGLFESMVVLTTVLGLTYLFLSIVIKQVWFGSVMAWIMFGMTALSAVVAKPASGLQHHAKTPWIIFHGLSMTLSGTMIVVAGAMSFLFLLCRWRLKHKQINKVVGRLPNIETLERMNILGLRACFVLMSFGLVSGIGVAVVRSEMLAISAGDWFTDSKIIVIAVAWTLIAVILFLKEVVSLSAKRIAQMTLVAVFLILFALVGATIFCGSAHDFSNDTTTTIKAGK